MIKECAEDAIASATSVFVAELMKERRGCFINTEDEAGCQEYVTRLIESEVPSDVIQSLGLWLACKLRSLDFRWNRSRRSLARRASGRFEEINLESSRYNRRGVLIEVRLASLGVHDELLRDWRIRNSALTVGRPDSVLGIVCWVSYYDISQNFRAVLTDPFGRVAASELILEDIERTAIPWLASTRDLEVLVSSVPDALLRPTAFAQDLIELLVSRGMTDQASALVERFASLSSAHDTALRQGRDMATKGERPLWHTPPAVGWSSYVLGLG